MGYVIQYEPELNHKYKMRSAVRISKRFAIGISLCAVLIVLCLYQPTRQWLWEFIVPGDEQVTQSAFSQMLRSLQDGEQVGDAVTAFCVEILENAK